MIQRKSVWVYYRKMEINGIYTDIDTWWRIWRCKGFGEILRSSNKWVSNQDMHANSLEKQKNICNKINKIIVGVWMYV